MEPHHTTLTRELEQVKGDDVLKIEVWDYDNGGSKDDALGSCEEPLDGRMRQRATQLDLSGKGATSTASVVLAFKREPVRS